VPAGRPNGRKEGFERENLGKGGNLKKGKKKKGIFLSVQITVQQSKEGM